MIQGDRAEGAAPRSLRAVALLATVLLAGPGVYLVIRNFTDDADPGGLLFSERTLAPLWRTLQLATLVSMSAAVLGTGLAWLTTRTDLPFKRLFRVLLILPLVYPTFIGAAALVRTLNPGGLVNDALSGLGVDRTPTISGLSGSWLVLTLFTYPYVYLPVAARFARLPGSIEQSARLLGNSATDVFRRIILPQAFGSVAAGTLLVFCMRSATSVLSRSCGTTPSRVQSSRTNWRIVQWRWHSASCCSFLPLWWSLPNGWHNDGDKPVVHLDRTQRRTCHLAVGSSRSLLRSDSSSSMRSALRWPRCSTGAFGASSEVDVVDVG